MVRYRSEILVALLNILLIALGLLLADERLLVVSQFISLTVILWKVHKNQLLLLIVLFFAMYLVPLAAHYFFHIRISFYSEYNNDTFFYNVLLCQTIYFLFFSVVLVKTHKKEIEILTLPHHDSSAAFWFCVVCVLITTFVGRMGETIFIRGGYGKSGDYSRSAIFEYCYIFYALAFIYCGNNSKKIILLKVLAIIYGIWAFFFGARIEILAMLILVFSLFYQKRFKTRHLLVIVLIAYLLFTIFGVFRRNLSFSFTNLGSLVGYYETQNVIRNNETEVFYSSVVILASIRTRFVSTSYRLRALINYLIRWIIPTSLLNADYNVVPYLQHNFSLCGGGGFFSSFSYFYLGWLGVALGGIFSALLWNKVETSKNQSAYWQMFILLSVVMTPRWFAYSPEAIVKVPLYTVIGYILTNRMLKIRKSE